MKSCLLSHQAYQLDDILYTTNYTSLICEDTRFHFSLGCLLLTISWIISNRARSAIVFLIYLMVSIIILLSANSVLIFIPWMPTFLLNTFLSSSYGSQFSRKWSIDSFSAPHSHMGVSNILNQYRYSFKWQCVIVRSMLHVFVVVVHCIDMAVVFFLREFDYII
jgi:hypothetical protein